MKLQGKIVGLVTYDTDGFKFFYTIKLSNTEYITISQDAENESERKFNIGDKIELNMSIVS